MSEEDFLSFDSRYLTSSHVLTPTAFSIASIFSGYSLWPLISKI